MVSVSADGWQKGMIIGRYIAGEKNPFEIAFLNDV
jgi:hypothetical protein